MLPCATGAPSGTAQGMGLLLRDGLAGARELSGAESACIRITEGRQESRIAQADPRERREGCQVVLCPWSQSLIHGECFHNALVLPSRYVTPQSTGSDQQER